MNKRYLSAEKIKQLQKSNIILKSVIKDLIQELNKKTVENYRLRKSIKVNK